MADATEGPDQKNQRWATERAAALALTPEQQKIFLDILGSTAVLARNFCEAGKADKALPLLQKLDALATAMRWKRKEPGGADSGK
jgi:hypothetical protein